MSRLDWLNFSDKLLNCMGCLLCVNVWLLVLNACKLFSFVEIREMMLHAFNISGRGPKPAGQLLFAARYNSAQWRALGPDTCPLQGLGVTLRRAA